MTRSIRDLRDIVNISRLSIHDDRSDGYSSNSDSASDSDEELSEYICNRPSTAMLKSAFQTSFVARPSSEMGERRTCLRDQHDSRPNTAPVQGDANKHNYQDCNNNNINGNEQCPAEYMSKLQTFPSKYTPIPPIGTSSESSRHSIDRRHLYTDASQSISPQSSDVTSISPNDENTLRLTYCDDTQVVRMNNNNNNKDTKVNKKKHLEQMKNFDTLFQYLDGTIIATWLEKCNEKLNYIDQFMKGGDNFIKFASFFLTQIPFSEYTELIDLEFSIVIDHFKYGFHSGFGDGCIKLSELDSLAKCVIWEYPGKLKKCKRGPKLLLDMIIIFCSGRTNAYRRLLKDIHCHSSNKQNIQWLLSIRAFGLISFISGILKFYENAGLLKDMFVDGQRIGEEHEHLVINNLIIQAVCCGYLDVLDYFYTNHNVDFSLICDEKERNLVSIAVSGRKYEALHYLLKLPVKINADAKSENGGTSLQCAVTYNDVKLALILLEHGVKVNAWNEQADGATALHMAVMLGNVDMVKLLLCHGADKSSRMGVPAHTTALVLARDMEHTQIIEVLLKHTT